MVIRLIVTREEEKNLQSIGALKHMHPATEIEENNGVMVYKLSLDISSMDKLSKAIEDIKRA